VDQHGAVIDILVQPKRDRRAAILFFRKLLRTTKRKPRVIITDKPRSYGAAKKVVLPRVTHRQSCVSFRQACAQQSGPKVCHSFFSDEPEGQAVWASVWR